MTTRRKAETMYPGNSHLVEVTELLDALTGELVTGAVVEALLYDAYMNLIPGQEFPTEMEEQEPGYYLGILASAIELDNIQKGILEIRISMDEVQIAKSLIPVEFKDRRDI